MESTVNACRTLRASAASVLRFGIHPAIMNPIVCAKIVRQICFAKALYGCEIWGHISDTEILMLERAQRYICKTIQGLPKLTRTDMCLSLLGWKPIHAIISEKKLLFFGQICNLPVTAVSFKILVRRLITIKQCPNIPKKLGFTHDCVSLIVKYNLMEYLSLFLENGTFPSKNVWKNIVKSAINEFEIIHWKQRLFEDNEFQTFRKIHSVYRPHPAWTVALRHPYYLKQARYLISLCCLIRTDTETKLCEKCGKLFTDPCVNAMTSCDYLVDTRDNFWCDIINLNPITFSAYLGCLSDDELCTVIYIIMRHRF